MGNLVSKDECMIIACESSSDFVYVSYIFYPHIIISLLEY